MTKAQELLAKFGGKTQATVTVGDREFLFHYDAAMYDAFLTEVTDQNKLTPVRDYLLAVVEPAQKEELAEYLTISQMALDIFKVVDAAFKPKIEIKLKNS